MKQKKLLSIILTVCLLFSSLYVTPVLGAVHSGTDGSIQWSYDDVTKTLTLSGSGATKKYDSTDKAPWDEYMLNIEHLIVENNVSALYGDIIFCHALKTVKLSDSVKIIGEKVFGDCEDLESVEFGNGLVTIEKQAFIGAGFNSIKLPDSLRTIGSSAFDGCSGLYEVDLGNGVETIGEDAFLDCPSLLSIKIPNSVKIIGKNAFGYVYDEVYDSKTDVTDYNWFPISYFEVISDPSNTAAINYANSSGVALVIGEPSISKKTIKIKAGQVAKLSVKNAGVRDWGVVKSTIADVDRDGNVSGLKKGTTKVIAYLSGERQLECTVKVTSSPKLKVGGKAFSAKKTYKIKKGSSLTIKAYGKAKSVDNIYKTSNKKVAKVTSKVTAKKIKIKGYKKGKATVTIKVNKKAFKVKVKVY